MSGTARASAQTADGREPALLVSLARRMLLIREFESLPPTLHTRGLVRDSSLAALGQKAVALDSSAASDIITMGRARRRDRDQQGHDGAQSGSGRRRGDISFAAGSGAPVGAVLAVTDRSQLAI